MDGETDEEMDGETYERMKWENDRDDVRRTEVRIERWLEK